MNSSFTTHRWARARNTQPREIMLDHIHSYSRGYKTRQTATTTPSGSLIYLDTLHPAMLPAQGQKFLNGMLLSRGNDDRILALGGYFKGGHQAIFEEVNVKEDAHYSVKWAGELHFRNPHDRDHVGTLVGINTTSSFAIKNHPWAVDKETREVWIAARLNYALPFDIDPFTKVDLFDPKMPNLFRSLGRFHGYHDGHVRRQGFINLIWSACNFILMSAISKTPRKKLEHYADKTPAAFEMLLYGFEYYALQGSLNPDDALKSYRHVQKLLSGGSLTDNELDLLTQTTNQVNEMITNSYEPPRIDIYHLAI